MTNKPTLTADHLREILNYDSVSGVFWWRVARRGGAKVGDIAGLINQGYRKIRIGRHRYKASRLAWRYIHGRWPDGEIDHKNGIRTDDRLDNLRDVTSSENAQNRRHAQSSNKTGFLGVSPHQGKFQAVIVINGKQHYLGRFVTPEDAHAVYLEAKRRLHAGCTI